jgi:hypothetical protein
MRHFGGDEQINAVSNMSGEQRSAEALPFLTAEEQNQRRESALEIRVSVGKEVGRDSLAE